MLSSKVVAAKSAYPQPEGTLGEVMIKSGRKLGDESVYGETKSALLKIVNLFLITAQSLTEMGEAMKQLAEVKFALEDNCKQNFLEPLTHLQNKDIRDVLV